MFLYQKLIDRSTLRQGFQIPVEFHHLLKTMPGGMPKHGETQNVKVVIDGVGYDALLKSQGFDRNKYDGHADVIQIRYSEGSALAKRLREVFFLHGIMWRASRTCMRISTVSSLSAFPRNIRSFLP